MESVVAGVLKIAEVLIRKGLVTLDEYEDLVVTAKGGPLTYDEKLAFESLRNAKVSQDQTAAQDKLRGALGVKGGK